MDTKGTWNHWPLYRIVILACILFVILWCCTGCITIPLPLEEAIHEAHKGDILIAEDYIKLVVKYYEGEERNDRLLTTEKWLKLSIEIDKYVEGKGGKIVLPWSKIKEVSNE
jgi:hypothetical protein